jgi:ribosomal-protein-alanine N-acetyltransferase
MKTASELAVQATRYQEGLSTCNHKFAYFFICLTYTNDHIGWCGYHTCYIDHRKAEIGYMVDAAHHNQGYMMEAVHVILRYGFETMKLHHVEALVGARNLPSLRILQNFCFTQEGVLQGDYRLNEGKRRFFIACHI